MALPICKTVWDVFKLTQIGGAGLAASDVIGSGTADGLLAFCDYLVDRGIAPGSAISPWKSAAKQVFTRVEGTEDFGSVDIKTLDVDEYMDRFINKSRGEYKPDSLNAYGNRFRKAVEGYRGYLADPMGWRPKLRASVRRSPESGSNGRTDANRDTGTRNAGPSGATGTGAPDTVPPPSLITYPFPLKSGQLAQLQLPPQLHREDAERLTQFVRALVFEQPRQLSSGEPDEE